MDPNNRPDFKEVTLAHFNMTFEIIKILKGVLKAMEPQDAYVGLVTSENEVYSNSTGGYIQSPDGLIQNKWLDSLCPVFE